MSVILLALLLALAIDKWLGEPAPRLHPVVWMGNYLSAVEAWFVPTENKTNDRAINQKSFALGAMFWLAGAVCVWALAAAAQDVFLALPLWLAVVLMGLVLKPLFAWQMLHSEVLAVETTLGQSLEAGRAQLARLVSRDVTQLTAEQVRESAIETLAENFNDSVVAPLFWYVLLGLPGAALYRFANTADAMWGYRGIYRGRYFEWAGKWAARADDVLSWIPARITALLLVAVSRLNTEGRQRFSMNQLCSEAQQTPSPNSGWPMAAMALALGVSLHKPSVYCLNAQGRAPVASDTLRSIRLAQQVWWILLVSAVIAGCVLGASS